MTILKTIYFPLWTLLVLASSTGLFGQTSVEEVANLSLKDGLSDRAVRDIIQDNDGFIWVATNNGLNRFDGYHFLVFDNNETTTHRILQNRLHNIELLENGQIALVNNDNLSFFETIDPHSFVTKKVDLNGKSGLTGTCVSVHLEKGGDAYVVTAQERAYGIFRSDEKMSFHQIGRIDIAATPDIEHVSFFVGNKGNLWLYDERNGLFKTNEIGKILFHWPIEHLLSKTNPTDVNYRTGIFYEDKKGTLWLSLSFRQGLMTIRQGETEITFPPGLPQDEVYFKIWEDHLGNISIGTFLAYWKIKQLFGVKKDGTVVNQQYLIDIESTIGSLFKPENENILFLGTFVGIFKVDFTEKPLKWLLADRQLEDNQWDDGISIRNITGGENGDIFISRELSAWYRTKEGKTEVNELELKDENGDKIKLWCCSNVVYDEDGFLWGGSCTQNRFGLLHRYDTKNNITKTFALESKAIRHMIQAKNGDLVLATGADNSNGKLLFFNKKKGTTTIFIDEDGVNPIADTEPQFVYESKNGELWVGTKKGLFWIDSEHGEWARYRRENSDLTNDDITSIHETENGELLLGTHSGLNIFKPESGKVKSYNTSHGLSNNVVANIMPDGENGYWIPTYYGLSHFNPQDGLFSTFQREKGFTFNEFNRMAMHRDSKGAFYFGTINGINVFRNEELKKAPFDKMMPQWTKINIYNEGVKREEQLTGLRQLGTLKLGPNDDLIRFEFCHPVFESVLGNRFAVRLEGRDTAWRYLGNQNYYELNNPPAGKYQLRLKAIPNNGMWSEHERSVDIIISKAYYQTMWFIIGLPLLILGLTYIISKWSIRRIRKKEEEQTQINKKFAELELQALQSQMNPHFVFNSLGAIQYFIQNNNQQAADEYLAKFAKLMRLFLESSKNKYISLEEEIKLLSLYIELEQMRFEDKFDAEIVVDKGLDSHAREVPSILIQPFIENAINHGLFNKQSKGKLRIAFSENRRGSLVCVIEDNGGGRKQAEQVKKQSARNYKSRGMQIVRERLEVMQEVDDVKIEVHVQDLDVNAKDPGTKVSIEIEDFD